MCASEANKDRNSRSVDARIINLYQGSVNGDRLFAEHSQYNVFAHYELIDVLDANTPTVQYTDDSPLLRAYCTSSHHPPSDPQQTLLAFTDIISSKMSTGGYTQQQIDDFWNCHTEPLLFLSMISLDVDQEYASILEKIDTIYADSPHLAYITFDYCNVLVFSRGSSFQQAARHILSLDYSSDQNIVDSITLYSFAYNYTECLPSEMVETFGAYLRFGVADMEVMERFETALKSAAPDKKVEKNWIIGRHDVGILCYDADLRWLSMAWEKAKQFHTDWYVNFTLSIMIRPVGNTAVGKLPSQTESSSLPARMEQSFSNFKEVYEAKCKQVNISTDNVWLRWLHVTSQQAVKLLENKMTRELGVSLVPQFLDFFQYAQLLWSNPDLELGKKWDEAEKCFSVLLSNISILVDSMNHHSRQFISSPPFRTVAFEMPPKLMAYYTMVLHQLISILQDDTPSRQYGFTITPQFTHTLNVRSLTEEYRHLLPDSQYITIGVSEEAMFRLQHTTAALTHEISHFVGWKGRRREIRKENIVYTELYNTILAIAERFCESLMNYYGICEEITDFTESSLPNMVIQLQGLLVRYQPQYEKNIHFFSEDLKVLLQFLPYKLHNTNVLCNFLFECCWKLLIEQDGILLELGSRIQGIECQRTGLPPDAPCEALNLSKQNLYRIFKNVLQAYSSENCAPLTEMEPRWHKICALYSETFADLQAILLLELDFSSYISLFVLKSDDTLPQIEWSRILALVVTLEGTKGWDVSDFAQNQTVEELRQFYNAADRFSLNNKDVDLIAIQKLSHYLHCCSDSLKSKFNSDSNDSVKHLRELYKSLSNENTAIYLVENLSREIQQYRKLLLDPQGSNDENRNNIPQV